MPAVPSTFDGAVTEHIQCSSFPYIRSPDTVRQFEARLEVSTGLSKAIVYVAHAVREVVSIILGVQARYVAHIDLLMHIVDHIEIKE